MFISWDYLLYCNCLFYVTAGSKTTCATIAILMQLFPLSTRNSSCYSKPGSIQCTTQVAKNFAAIPSFTRLFRVSTRNSCRYSDPDLSQFPTWVAKKILLQFNEYI